MKIIEHLNWQAYFKGVYSLDSFNPIVSSKKHLLSIFLDTLAKDKSGILYVGDRFEDKEAAVCNDIRFLMAKWGYDNYKTLHRDISYIDSPHILLNLLNL